jgi:LuxR family maltose regulon positive regulatory protein
MSGAAAALSPRERCILELIGGGQSNKEIARALGIAPETVKSHVKNMFVKLSVERRAQAVYRAQSLGMMAPGYQVPAERFDQVYQG